MEKTATYKVDRNFCEKLIALLNHSTNPVMDIFQVGKKKVRVIIDYDPQTDKIEITYYEEDVC